MNKSGFTLIEALISAALVAILVALTASVTMTTVNASQRMERSDNALNLARTTLESTIYQPFDQLACKSNGGELNCEEQGFKQIEGYPDYGQMFAVEDINAYGNTELKRVTVTVRWQPAGNPSSVTESLTTCVGR